MHEPHYAHRDLRRLIMAKASQLFEITFSGTLQHLGHQTAASTASFGTTTLTASGSMMYALFNKDFTVSDGTAPLASHLLRAGPSKLVSFFRGSYHLEHHHIIDYSKPLVCRHVHASLCAPQVLEG